MPFLLCRTESSGHYACIPADRGASGLPIIVFLHGAGERGTDPADALQGGLKAVFESLNIPAVVLFPQCSPEYRAYYGAMEERVLQAIDGAVREFSADCASVYLIGYSMGATSCFYLAARHPGRFAAIASIAVGISWPEHGWPPNLPDDKRELFRNMFIDAERARFIAGQVKTVPVWFIHGSQDRACPVTDSRSIVDQLRAFGATARLTEYPELGHDSLVRGLNEEGLFQWLLSNSAPAL